MKPKSKFLTLLNQITEDVDPQAVDPQAIGQGIAQGVSGINTAKTNYDAVLAQAFAQHPDGQEALKDPAKLQALLQKITQASSTTSGDSSNVSVPSGVTPAV